MIAASQPVQRPRGAKLLVIGADGSLQHLPRSALAGLLGPGDVVIANNAATLPASLHGTHERTGAPIEVRLAGRNLEAPDDPRAFIAIVFGAGDFHTRTEDRPAPPALAAGDRLRFGVLGAAVERLLGHPRLIAFRFEGTMDTLWAGLAAQGRPIQYAHVSQPLELWDVWTPIAAAPVAFEPPSAGFALDWALLAELRQRGIDFATLTHAAGISSTGDSALDAWLPLDEPYDIPIATAEAIRAARACGERVVAIGTTVVRALEHAALTDGTVRAGRGLAIGRIDVRRELRVVDVLLSGTHEPGSSHYDLLGAFADAPTLARASAEMETRAYRTHEFGDSQWVEKRRRPAPEIANAPATPSGCPIDTERRPGAASSLHGASEIRRLSVAFHGA
jgi:S-adenosylmethionine:tRNA ribosyltransferase-isomerase